MNQYKHITLLEREMILFYLAKEYFITKIACLLGSGKEFSKHFEVSAALGVEFYFPFPHHPWQRGTNENTNGLNRRISKRGSSTLRKIGYEVMRSLKAHAVPEDHAVYDFVIKKELEGKPKKVAKIAGLNKFLRIYYARVKEVYQ